MAKLDEKFIVNLKGKDFVEYGGLVDLAHQEGLISIDVELLQIPTKENNMTAICKATAKTDKATFVDVGDASPASTNTMIQPHIIRMASCVPTRAKILTKHGWKEYSELKIGEMVLAYDLEQDMNKWVELLDVSVFKDIPLFQMKNKSFYTECTHDHKWVVQNNDKISLREFNNLRNGDRIITSAYTQSGDHSLTPREAAILGWLITDGSIRETTTNGQKYLRFTIYQSKPHYVEEIKELLKGIGSWSVERNKKRDFGEYVSECLDAYKFTVKASYGRKLLKKANFEGYDDLIPLITNLSSESRKSMLDAMLKADGHKKRKGEGNWVFGKKKAQEKIMSAFEILCTLEGITLGMPRRTENCNMPIRTLSSFRRSSYSYMQTKKINNSDVWCPTTKYGTWIMSLDGNISITGNTRAKARALRDLTNIGMTALEELGGESPGTNKAKPKKTNNKRQQNKSNDLTDKQIARLYAIASSKGISSEIVKAQVKKKLSKKVQHMTRKEYDIVCKGYEGIDEDFKGTPLE